MKRLYMEVKWVNIPNNVKVYYTEKEFEEIQANFNGKAEYENGEIILASNTSIKHNLIKGNILAALIMYLKGSKCRAYDEQIEVIFKNESELHKYKPDVFVMCDNPEKQGESFLSPPKIIFEVYLEALLIMIILLNYMYIKSLVFLNIILLSKMDL